jgi:hypothetical protein
VAKENEPKLMGWMNFFFKKTIFKTHPTYMWLLDNYMCPQQFDV